MLPSLRPASKAMIVWPSGPTTAPSGWWPCSASQAGAVLVPINTRYKGAEAADILLRSRAKTLVTVTDFLGSDYVSMLKDTGVELPDLSTVVVAGGTPSVGAESWDDFLARGRRRPAAEAARRALAVGAGRRLRHPLHLGHDGPPQGGPHPRPHAARGPRLGPMTGLRRGTATWWCSRSFTASDTRRASSPAWWPAPPSSLRRSSTPTACSTVARGAGERAARAAGAVPIHARPRRSGPLPSLVPAPRRHRRCRHPRRAHPPAPRELAFETVITGYGLTEGGHRTCATSDDDPETIATTSGRALPGFEVRDRRRRRARAARRRAGRGHPPRPQRHARLPRRPGGDRRGPLRRRLAAHGRHRRDGRARDVSASSTAKDMFIVGGFNAYPAEIENASPAPSRGQPGRGHRRPRRAARRGGRGVCGRRPGRAVDRADIIAWCRERMANYKVPRRVEIVEELPPTPRARC